MASVMGVSGQALVLLSSDVSHYHDVTCLTADTAAFCRADGHIKYKSVMWSAAKSSEYFNKLWQMCQVSHFMKHNCQVIILQD